MLPDIGGESGAKLVMAIGAVAIALLLFFLVLRAWRQRGTRAFLRGGKNRRPRLAVLDAAAVDPRRRLVLVRRDDVEHLILIGGPSDVVVESGIGASGGADIQALLPAATAGFPAAPAEVPDARARVQEDVAPAGDRSAVAPSQPGAEHERAAAGGEPARLAPTAAPATTALAESETGAAPQPPAAEASGELDAGHLPSAVDEDEARPDIAAILDSQRQRVFGPSEQIEAHAEPVERSPYEQAYMEDKEEDAKPAAAAGTPRTTPAASVLRFEDFLDTEVAGELSSLTPERISQDGRAGPPVESSPPAARDEVAADARSRTLDEEMSRLLQQLSHKR